MKKIRIKKSIKKFIEKVKENYLLEAFFVLSNLFNATLLRVITVKNILSIQPLLADLGYLILLLIPSSLFKRKKKIYYFMTVTIILSLVCLANSIYFHYYDSFISFSLLSIVVFAKDVGDAIFENVLKLVDLLYLIVPILLYIFYKKLKKKNYFNILKTSKINNIKLLITTLVLWGIASIIMPISAWGKLYKLWNRQSAVMNFGVYIYQIDDAIQSLSPKINSAFGHDNALKATREYYKKNKYTKKTNKYTNIFEGKNIIVIHAESIQTFAMKLSFNGQEVTPVLNRLSKEGIFFSNFYSEVGVGTSSDAEFTFNTSLMPSTRGTVFVSYFDREYVSIPKLLKEKNYNVFSMHANNGNFWNRDVMHKNLGYNKFYSKESYNIDEEIGLGLSDKSFFSQSVDIIKKEKEENNKPFYSLLIMLSNHTPFSDLELMPEYSTNEYLEGTTLGNYIKSVHYADEAIGEFINKLDKEGLLENTVLMIYGDHDARLPQDDFNLLYNYDENNNIILTEEDDNYFDFNDYEYELNRKVPFIIWTKDNQIKEEVTIPTGMIDVLPTIGNMFDFHSDYQLGRDIFNNDNNDNIVPFIDGSFITSKIYYYSPKSEIYMINNEPITEEYIKECSEYSANLIDISNNIISYDLIKELKGDKR